MGVQVRGCPSWAGLFGVGWLPGPLCYGPGSDFLELRVTPHNVHHDKGQSQWHRAPSLCSLDPCVVPKCFSRAVGSPSLFHPWPPQELPASLASAALDSSQVGPYSL